MGRLRNNRGGRRQGEGDNPVSSVKGDGHGVPDSSVGDDASEVGFAIFVRTKAAETSRAPAQRRERG